MSDLIDRQQTIGALDALCDRECEYSKQQRRVMCGACRLGSAFDVIDELPSVQPETSTDFIDRQAAVNSVANGLKNVFVEYHDVAEKLLNNVPSVQPDFDAYCDRLWKLAYERGKRDAQPQRWIPVTERLPRDDEEVIVTCLDDSGDTPFSYTTVAWHYKGMWVCETARCPFVVAWKPLPEPYKEGQK